MANTEHYLDASELHPIDIVETLATNRDWDFDRIADDQIAMAVEGSWRTYAITLAWSDYDETLRMICTFDMEPPADRLPALFETLNSANDTSWAGAFSLWQEQKLMVYRYGLVLSGGASASPEQIDHLLHNAVLYCERFYPAFQLVCWGGEEPAKAMEIAIAEAYGRA